MNKVALVTGGSRGIGAAVCKALAKLGYAVVVNYRSRREAAMEVVEAIKSRDGLAVAVQADVSDPQARRQLLQHTLDWQGNLHVLVNNAGIAPPQRRDILELTEEEYHLVFGVNLHAAFWLSQQAAKAMLEQTAVGEHRAIINISSISAQVVSTDRAAYCMAKAGLSMLTRLLAVRLAESGIGVYEIRPGITATDMTASVRKKYDRLITGGLVPQKRWGQPEDVARAVAAIVSGHFAYGTGQVFYVDGGLHIQSL